MKVGLIILNQGLLEVLLQYMEKYYPTLDKEYWDIITFSPKHTYILVSCRKCRSRWRVEKKDAEKELGMLQLLNHEYGHRNRNLEKASKVNQEMSSAFFKATKNIKP